MANTFLQQLIIEHPELVAFALNYAASVAWDTTKASVRGLYAGLKSAPPNFETQFKELTANDQLSRHAQHLIAEVVKSQGLDAASVQSADMDLLADAVVAFLEQDRVSGLPLTDLLVQRAKELNLALEREDECTLPRFVSAFIVAIARGPLAIPTLLRVGEMTLRGVTEIRDQQATQLPQIADSLQGLSTKLDSVLATSAHSGINTVGYSSRLHGVSQVTTTLSMTLQGMGLTRADTNDFDSSQVLLPPELPPQYVPRMRVRTALEDHLRNRPVLAVTGYPSCGKSSALADFVKSTGRTCIWIDVPTGLHSDADAVYLISIALQIRLGAASLAVAELRNKLSESASQAPLVIVIDNAERIGDPKAITFLIEAAVGLNGNLWLLLAYSDDNPDFTLSAHRTLIPTWRLPGMNTDEASELFEALSVVLDEKKRALIELIRIQCEGHIGILLLSRSVVEQSDSASGAKLLASIQNTDSIRGFIDALTQRFVSTFSSDVSELCRRLAIANDHFTMDFGLALWNVSKDSSRFMSVWTTCRATVLEVVGHDRFRLPHLYRLGLRRDIPTADAQRWNDAAADYLLAPKGKRLNVDDAYHCVLHRVLANNYDGALRDAFLFLGAAHYSNHAEVLEYLDRLYGVILTDSLVDAHASVRRAIRWAAIRLMVARELGQLAEEEKRLHRLVDVLRNVSKESNIEERRMAWSQVLIFAMHHHNIQLAWEGFDALPSKDVGYPPETESTSALVLVYGAYQRGSNQTKDFIYNVTSRVANKEIPATVAWDDSRLYEVWRVVGAGIYNELGDAKVTSIEYADGLFAEYESSVQSTIESGLIEIGVCLTCALVLARIDLLRNLPGAVALAESMPIAALAQSPLRAYALSVKGDAFRCNERFADALPCYQEALAVSHEPYLADRAQTQISLAVTLARLGRLDSASDMITQVTRTLSADDALAESSLHVRALCEATAIAMAARRLDVALDLVIDIHSILSPGDGFQRDWPILAKLALDLAGLAKADASNGPPPIPGFTFGLPAEIPGADQMIPCAPTIAVGHACSALGRHSDALKYYELAYPQLPNDEMRHMQSFVAFPSALAIKDLRMTVLIGSRLCSIPAPSMTVPYETHIREFVLPRTISLVVAEVDSNGWESTFNACLELLPMVSDSGNVNLQLISASMQGIRQALTESDATGLANAYQLALNAKAYGVARDLAWTWCYRYFVGRPEPIANVLRWQWRLSWLSVRTLSNDVENLNRSNANQRHFWRRLNEVIKSDLTARISSVFERESSTVEEAAQVQLGELASATNTKLGHSHFFPELGEALHGGVGGEWIERLRTELTGQLSTFVLSPAADDIKSNLDESLHLLDQALAMADSSIAPQLSEWRADCDALQRILERTQESPLNNAVVASLVRLKDIVEHIAPESASTWFVLLSQCLEGHGGDDIARVLVDHLMVKYGLPDDRRKNVEDDVHKIGTAALEQNVYCRYLEPQQDLTHMRSVDTAYTRPTQYTFRCTLLEVHTNIETPDIAVALDSMKRNYCATCDKRWPGNSPAEL